MFCSICAVKWRDKTISAYAVAFCSIIPQGACAGLVTFTVILSIIIPTLGTLFHKVQAWDGEPLSSVLSLVKMVVVVVCAFEG